MTDKEYKELIAVLYLDTGRFEFNVIPADKNGTPAKAPQFSKTLRCLVWSSIFEENAPLDACKSLYENVRNSMGFLLCGLEENLKKRFLSRDSSDYFSNFVENLQRNNPK